MVRKPYIRSVKVTSLGYTHVTYCNFPPFAKLGVGVASARCIWPMGCESDTPAIQQQTKKPNEKCVPDKLKKRYLEIPSGTVKELCFLGVSNSDNADIHLETRGLWQRNMENLFPRNNQ